MADPSSRLPSGGSEMYDQMKRHEVLVLRQAEFSLREVARRAKVSLDTVERILHEVDGTFPPPRTVGQPMVAASFEASVQQILGERPDLPTV